MLPRRIVLTIPALLLPGISLAQQGGFVGQWEGTVDGIGWTKIVITSVRPDGLVEGRMEFALHYQAGKDRRFGRMIAHHLFDDALRNGADVSLGQDQLLMSVGRYRPRRAGLVRLLPMPASASDAGCDRTRVVPDRRLGAAEIQELLGASEERLHEPQPEVRHVLCRRSHFIAEGF